MDAALAVLRRIRVLGEEKKNPKRRSENVSPASKRSATIHV
jgi:hypothetical protein